ncbi:NAD(P)-binding protein [Laetiporus sulphureus 93-53]|uniref:NAD(P)-binding protein n=1 Tax=Laetiporus sulphureus 93-53 TaxID=1314785 RepID=A0A165IN94_9APHY|nr:NAD(P)-binding protein [Laetiporus sulphureus 93-53]KZT13316.1 NAD(P)-binding protein [Laetiporus sulphureus 93-53]
MSRPLSFTAERALALPADEFEAAAKKPRVVVTGGSGKLGRAAVVDLFENGWEVINFDRAAPPPSAPKEIIFIHTELQDMGQVMENLIEVDTKYKKIDAIVHLAALPAPGMMASSTQFSLNAMSTYNILEASRKLGIKNLVLASSETLLGLPFSPWLPDRIPVDENSPRRPESAYSLSKLVGEVMSEEYARWDPSTKIVSLRFSNVQSPEDYAAFETWQKDPMIRKWNLFGYIDARDGAQAIRKSLEYKATGHHQFLIANSNTTMRVPNADLVAACFPGIPYMPTKGKNDTLLSIDKAKRELGYSPKWDWK